ncbi:MAG TPA: hypothetical protein VJH68_04100 [Candidatus Nanoarchaeia archaeon]|nr:hypothetical protein [Candidatus Nanoarchaeia archaeon]
MYIMSNNLPYVSAVIAIVVIVAVVLGINSDITGALALGRLRGSSPACSETDPGQDESVLGVVSIQERDSTREYPDTCFGKTLVQYFCANTVDFQGVGRYCKNGCLNGVCLGE